MKILFTIADLQYSGGTETLTYTILKELISRNHQVFLYTSRIGDIAGRFIDLGVVVVDNLMELPDDIEIIHAQHQMEAILAYIRYPLVPMVFTANGIIPWQEQPILVPSVVKYIAVSEEVKSSLITNWNIPESLIEIVRNGIDRKRFYPKSPINKIPRNLLLLSNRFTPKVEEVLLEVASEMNLKLEIIGQSVRNLWNVEDKILDADIVVSLGRGILEAMSCGRIPLVFDYNGGDDIVTSNNYYEIRKNNFSGRAFKRDFTPVEIVERIKEAYIEDTVQQNLELIEKYHDIQVIVDQIINIYTGIQHIVIVKQDSYKIISEYLFSGYMYSGKEIVNKEKNIRYLIEVNKETKAGIEKSTETINELSKSVNEYVLRNQALQQEINEATLMSNELGAQVSQLSNEIKMLQLEFNEDKKKTMEEMDKKENNSKYLLELCAEKDKQLSQIYTSRAWKAILKIRNVKRLSKKALRNPKWALKKIVYRNSVKISPVKKDLKSKVSIDNDNPLISVVIPIYDRTDVLRESINSILQQSYENFELLLVCDGSPKETLSIVEEYATHPKVRIFKFFNNSGNAVRGRNKAIVESRGQFLAFQDSDDIAESNRLELSLQYIEKYKADVVYGGWRAKVDGTRSIDIQDGQEVFSPDCDYEKLLEVCVPCQSTVMVRLAAVKAVGGLKTSMKYREDHELWLRLAYNGYKFKSIPLILTNLRLHQNNLELSFKDEDNIWVDLMNEEHKKTISLKPKIAYVIPGCGISGGIAVICQHANRLLNRGYDVILITEDNLKEISWFPKQKVQIVGLEEAPENLDIVIATGWSTAYTIAEIPAARKIYFVQSDESRFYPAGSLDSKRALESYKLNYELMTEAKWIQKWLLESFGKSSVYVPNGLDEEIVHHDIPIIPKKDRIRVLLEGPIDIPFKGMEDAFLAVKDLDCEIWCISSAGKPKEEWRCDHFFEKVPMIKMREFYSSCDILLKMSRVEGFFGPPLEMMACGGACVVSKVSGYDEYIINEHNALVVEMGDVAGAKAAVKRLIEDEELRRKLVVNGKVTADNWKWEPTIDILEKFILLG